MATTAEISVVIATHNRERCLRRVLPSYLEQEAVGEVILVDDGSQEPLTLAALGVSAEDAARVRIERMEPRRGAPYARNLGVTLARCPWVLFTDDDVQLGPEYCRELLECSRRTGSKVLAGRIVYLQDGESPEEAVRRCDAAGGSVRAPRYCVANFSVRLTEDQEIPYLHAVSMVPREVAERIRWDEGNPPPSYREETDFVIRSAAESGTSPVLCHAACCYHLSPSDTRTGGQRSRSWLTYELGVIRGNHRFYTEHFPWLRERGAVTGSRWGAEARFVRWRLVGGGARWLYGIYSRSGVRPLVRRVLQRT